MATHIVLISVDYNNSRKVCEAIQNSKYNSTTELFEELCKKLDVHSTDENMPMILSLDSFMDDVNDQLLDNLSEYFISYVTIE